VRRQADKAECQGPNTREEGKSIDGVGEPHHTIQSKTPKYASLKPAYLELGYGYVPAVLSKTDFKAGPMHR